MKCREFDYKFESREKFLEALEFLFNTSIVVQSEMKRYIEESDECGKFDWGLISEKEYHEKIKEIRKYYKTNIISMIN